MSILATLRLCYVRACLLAQPVLRALLACMLVVFSSCASLLTPEGVQSMHRRIDELARTGASAGHSIVELVAAAAAAAGLAGGGGFVAGRRSSSSGGRRRTDPEERPE